MTHPTNPTTPVNTHSVTYRGIPRECNQETMQDVCDALFAELGEPDYLNGQIPVVAPLDRLVPRPAPQERPALRLVTPQPAPVRTEVQFGPVSGAGKARSDEGEEMALEAGFAPKPPVYEAGTRVNETGVENARREQQDHDAKPFARDLAADLAATVKAELRRDTDPLTVSELRMSKTAALALPGGVRLPMNRRAFDGLVSRLPVTGGGSYLAQCPQELRAINVNHWAVELGRREAEDTAAEPKQAVVRTRQVNGKRSAFAVVTPSYTPFDTDKIAEALHLALPGDAKGEVQYDGQKMRLEALWRSDVAPEEFVAGEFFKAGVIVRADDTGAGSIRVQSVLWRNLCLNLIILDKAIGVDIRIRHTGSVQALAERFRESFGQALGSVDGFRRAWGYAMSERDEALVARSQGTTSDDITGLPVSAVLPGLLHGILDRELVPVRGRKADVIPALLEMHRQDEAADAYGVSRASIANAFTRYAHRVETDPFASDEIREGAGKLLSGSRGIAPAPLPYQAFVAYAAGWVGLGRGARTQHMGRGPEDGPPACALFARVFQPGANDERRDDHHPCRARHAAGLHLAHTRKRGRQMRGRVHEPHGRDVRRGVGANQRRQLSRRLRRRQRDHRPQRRTEESEHIMMTVEEAQDYWAEGVASVMPDHADKCVQMMRRTMSRKAAIAEFRYEHPGAAITVYDEPKRLSGKSPVDACWAHAEADSGGGPKLLVSGTASYVHTYHWQ